MATRSHTYYMFILLFIVCLTDAGGGNRLLTTLRSPMTPRSCDCVTALVTARGAVTFNSPRDGEHAPCNEASSTYKKYFPSLDSLSLVFSSLC